MQLEIHDEKVKKIICNPSLLQRKVGIENSKVIKRRMNQLKSADNFNQYLTLIALGKPHPLNGDLNKCYGISITGNYRMVIEPLNTELDMNSLKNCKVLNIRGVLDYHGGKYEWIIPWFNYTSRRNG